MNLSNDTIRRWAGLYGATGVSLGAFGAHALKVLYIKVYFYFQRVYKQNMLQYLLPYTGWKSASV